MSAVQVVLENVPKFLRERCLWCVWISSFVDREGRTRTGKFPCSPVTGRMTGVNRRSEWARFDPARVAFESSSRFEGLGVLLEPELELIGVDIDDCVEEDGSIKPSAVELFQHFRGNYCELSPSRRGFKVFGLGKLPAGMPKRISLDGCSVEIYEYSSNRLRSFVQNRQVGLVDEQSVTLPSRYLTQDAEKPHVLQGFRNGWS